MKLLLNVLICCVFLAALGCSPVYYQPNLMNMPNFQQRGEAYFAASLCGNNGSDFQVAYAFTDHFAVQGNFMSDMFKESVLIRISEPNINVNIKGHLGEFAVGYFNTLERSGTFGLFGGYGSGKISNDWSTEGVSFTNFNKPFIQLTFGTRSKYFELVTGLKLAQLRYYNQEQSFKNQTFIDEFDVIKSPMPIMEGGMTLKAGLKHVKLQLHGTLMLPLKPSVPDFPSQRISIGLGICLQLGGNKILEKKKSNENKVRYKLF